MARSPSKTAETPAASVTWETTPIMLIGGDDDFAIQQRARQVWDSWCKAAGGMDHDVFDGTASNGMEALTALNRVRESLQTLPFFGGPKRVWLQGATFLADDRTSSSKDVTEALARFSDELRRFDWKGVRLLISALKPDRRRAFFKTFEQRGVVELFNTVSVDDNDWATKVESEALRLFKGLGRSIDDDALQELVLRNGTGLRSLNNEVEKLHLHSLGNERITLGDVEAVVCRQKSAQSFALAEALGDRNLSAALHRLDEELWEIRAKVDKSKSEIGLLYGLISKVRNLLLIRELLDGGFVRPNTAPYALKPQLEAIPSEILPADKRYNPKLIHPYVLSKALRQAQNYRTPELVRGMELLLDANRDLVSSSADEARVLQRILVAIIGNPGTRRA